MPSRQISRRVDAQLHRPQRRRRQLRPPRLQQRRAQPERLVPAHCPALLGRPRQQPRRLSETHRRHVVRTYHLQDGGTPSRRLAPEGRQLHNRNTGAAVATEKAAKAAVEAVAAVTDSATLVENRLASNRLLNQSSLK